jgi:DNA ligase-associated metallophosphoesterase
VTGQWATRTARIEEPTESVLLQFAGHTFEPLPSGALHWPAERTLLVADLHLEKLSSYASRVRLLPPYDTALTLKRLEADVERTGAREVIALGDSFHRDEGASTLSDADRLRLLALLGRTRWTWISGNHDPAPHGFGAAVTSLERVGLTLTHVPRRGPEALVAGHLHPAATVHVNGRSARRPCFVHDGRTLVLPAYGSATGTLNIVDPAFAGLFDWSALEVVMIGRGRVYPVHPRRLIRGYGSW